MKHDNKSNIKAIVISDNHYNGLGVIRSLGMSKIDVILILLSEKANYISQSRYIKNIHIISHNEENILALIRKYTSSDYDSRYFIFPLSDFSAEIIDRNCKEFGDNVCCPNANCQMELLMNKEKMKEIAKECGLNVPKGIIADPLKPIPNWDSFPAIIKPLTSKDGLKSDIVIAKDRTEMQRYLDVFAEKRYNSVLVEEFVSGTDEYMLEVMGSHAKGCKVAFAGVIKKHREYPIKNGSTSYAHICESHPAISMKQIESFINTISYTGLFDIEFKYADGIAYFIECNYRNGAPGYIFSMLGRNIPMHWIGENINNSSIEMEKLKECDFIVEQADIINMLKKDVSVWKWVYQFLNAKKIFFSVKDIKPVVAYYYQFILSRILK